MKTILGPLLAGLMILALAAPPALLAQNGMFGSRNLGQPLAPGHSTQFAGAIQFGQSGSFIGVGRTNGGSMFSYATPWRRPAESGPYVYQAYPGGPVVAQYSQLPPTEMTPPAGVAVAPTITAPETAAAPQTPAMPQLPIQPEVTPVAPEATAPPPAGNQPAGQPGAAAMPEQPATEAGGAAAAAAAPAAAPAVATATRAIQMVTASTRTVNSEAAGYSPTMSAFLTRLAKDHGITVRSEIRVSMLNGTAVLRGTVGSSHERTLLANMAGLEPGIWRIDNQLAVASP